MSRVMHFINSTSILMLHTNIRFECLKDMISKNPSLRVVIPSDMEFSVKLGGKFEKFDKKTNNHLNNLYRKGKPLRFDVKGQTYEINRELTTQINIKTRYKREIKASFKNKQIWEEVLV